MAWFKHYVNVIALIEPDGSITPLALFWKGKRFKVDKVLGYRETYARSGGSGIRYECLFGNQERHLFYENGKRWFIENEKSPDENGAA